MMFIGTRVRRASDGATGRIDCVSHGPSGYRYGVRLDAGGYLMLVRESDLERLSSALAATDSATGAQPSPEVEGANSNARGETRTRKTRRSGDFESSSGPDGSVVPDSDLGKSESGEEDPDSSQVGSRSLTSARISATESATSAEVTDA